MRKILSALLLVGLLIGCALGETSKADLVVYGKIFTSESNQVVEAFAVKDGKYIYVGDKKGAEAFIEAGKTEVLDYTGKGLVMPGCGNGHAHYSMGHAISSVGTIVNREDDVEKFLSEIVPSAVKKARDTGAKSIFGFGWNIMNFQKNMPTRQQLDEICSDIPIYFADEEGHKGLVNTLALVNAGIMAKDGTVLKKEVRGGEIEIGTDGTPTGYLKEQAGTYVRSFLDNENLFTVETAKANMAKIQEQLLSEGYTMYLDGYSTYFFNDNFYEAAQQMDKAGNLYFVLGTAYELDSWMDVDARLAQALDAKKFASTRVKPNWMKLFMDGTVETGTGFIEPLYPDGHQGIPNWTEEELTEITRKVNEAGITMHVHVMGNKGVNRVVNSFINGGKDEMRNTLVHVYGVNQPDYQRMADHNIHVTSGMLWHHATDALQEALSKILPENMNNKGYPMKSYFDYGVNVSSHSDFPALSGAPDDPFGIMEIAVTGMYYPENAKAWWPEELITREQALTALTINVAKQMFIEDERGSVKEGKYADFLLVNKDVLSCPVTEIHTAKCEATYFEGKKVFNASTNNSAADLVIYGKIFTSEGNQIVEAFAVKDGKYIYVGDKKGAEAFIEAGKTEVVDYSGKGLVMPGCGNGHAHYMLGYALKTVGTTIDIDDEPNHFLTQTVPAAVRNAKAKGATSVFGQGWNYMRFKDNLPTRQQLDAICSDIPMYFLDDECHKALVNSILLVKAGIMKEDGTILMSELRGGEIGIGEDGTPNGYLAEQAQTYMRSFLDNDNLYTLDMAISNLAEIEHHMLSEGYTMYHEGWGNYFVNTNYYQAVQQMDKAGKLHFVLGLPYEIESWMNMDEALDRAVDAKKFASKRVMPNWIKLLMDGTVETGTGFVEPLYPDGHQGIPNWTEEELTELTRKANENGLTIHIHALGNKAVNCAVNAFINGGNDEMRNTLVHVRNVNYADYKRMSDHNIYVTSGVTWHHGFTGMAEYMRELGATPLGQEDKSYPFKSFFDNGIPVSIHSDYPALSGSPDDPFGIMEIAVTGVLHSENGAAWWPEELVTREQALTALTINVAKQMFIEDERGSIKEGKYADFLLVDKDVLTCPVKEIHEAKPEATYFEGKKVFESGAKESVSENKKITGDYDKSLAVKCVNGTFVGRKTENIITYKGIPFVGKQPVGNLRWKAPVDVIPDDGVYEAYYFGKNAYQSLELGEHQGEDCLYLNVWKADETSTEKKPVMVWIHGGAFVAGGTEIEIFDCTEFIKENPDVIVVTIQYRLGVFGFLHLSHLEDGKNYPDAQNLGLMDQRMALKWVHENIADFGGDPDNVTIWGESAGAGSVTLLPLMKDSQKYFKRAIAQSGSPSQTNSLEETIACTNDLMNALGCKTVADLMKIDTRKLVDTAGEVIAYRIFPVRDGRILPLDPYEAYSNGAAKNIAFLQGCNKDEMNCFVFDWGVENFKAWAADRKTKKYAHLLTDDEKARIESYCNEGAVESWEPDSRLFGHSWFIDGAIRMSENQTKAGGKSYTYYYRVESSPELKAAHFEEVPIVFCHPEMSGGRQDYDANFSRTMRKMWVQFAKTGNPSLSAEISPDGKAKTWPLYDLENKNVMLLDEFDIHPAKESEVKIVDWERTYFLTKYYML